MTRKIIRIILLAFCILLVIGIVTSYITNRSNPVLKFKVDTDIGFYILQYQKTYVLRENGKTQRIINFSTEKNVESYGFCNEKNDENLYLYFINLDSENDKFLNSVAERIVNWAEKTETDIELLELYCANSDFYFTAWEAKGEDRICCLYKYDFDENSVLKLASFDMLISDVEPM